MTLRCIPFTLTTAMKWFYNCFSKFQDNVISRLQRAMSRLLLELLYADDLFLMAESEESLRDKIVKWKSGLEAKGLKMNTGKTKVMFSCSMKDKAEEKGKWPCGVCKKGVGNNSILCHG